MKIIEDILLAAAHPQGGSKTQLVYRANLNFNRLKRYLPTLVEKGLIAVRENSQTLYFLTEKGRTFIRYSHKARELL